MYKQVTFCVLAIATIGIMVPGSSMMMQQAYASEPFIGQIQWVGFNFPPRGWAFCDGQLLQISQNTALFSLLGTTFGGDGINTFALPDMRGRSPVHPGTGAGLSTIQWGQRGGAEQEVLSTSNLPSHNHAAGTLASQATTNLGDSNTPTGDKVLSKTWPRIFGANANLVSMHSDSISGATANTGGNQAFDIRSPFLGVYCTIALVGIFPSRN